jgi:TRAP-type mannitol/chloroaromatic compound transport system permease large subunit
VRRKFGFWLVYAVAWLPFAASYANYFFRHLGQPLGQAVMASLTGVVPAALLGMGVVAICDRLQWSGKHRALFVSTHLVGGVLYFELWISAVQIFSWLEHRIESVLPTVRNPSAPSFDAGMITGLMIYATIAAIVYSIQAMERLQAEQARVAQLQNLQTRAELEALRAQLNPHFLFNTLHSLMALVRHNPKLAEDALEKLATLLRYTLMSSSQGSDVTLREEIDFVRDYLRLEQIRLGERLRVEEKLQREALDCMIPPLTLQPLIENSIKHAMATRKKGCLVTINANRHNGVLTLLVSDDGPGTSAAAVAKSAGSGLRIARQRLAARYRTAAAFEINTQPGQGFAIRMEIPATELAATSK